MKIVYSYTAFEKLIAQLQNVAVVTESNRLYTSLTPSFQTRVARAHEVTDNVVYIFQPFYHLSVGITEQEAATLFGQKPLTTVDEVLEVRSKEDGLAGIFIQIPGEQRHYQYWFRWASEHLMVEDSNEKRRALLGAPWYLANGDAGVTTIVPCPYERPYNAYVADLCEANGIYMAWAGNMSRESCLNYGSIS